MMNTLVWKDVFYAGTFGGGLGLLINLLTQGVYVVSCQWRMSSASQCV